MRDPTWFREFEREYNEREDRIAEFKEKHKPAKKEWVGLTYEELSDAYNLNYDRYYKTMDYVDFLLVYEAVEAKLKEKNGMD